MHRRLTPLIPVGVLAQTTLNDYQAYYFTTWIFLAFMLFFYCVIIGMTAPYARPRVPIWLFVVLIFFPPGFFFLLLYLLLVWLLFIPIIEPVAVSDSRDARRAPTSRSTIRSR
mgnify:CR=1 FL=1